MSWLKLIEQETGAAPPTCPWQAYTDPEVTEVLGLYADASTGDGCHIASLYPVDPPHHVLEGVRWYRSALNRARSNSRRREEERRKTAKPPGRR